MPTYCKRSTSSLLLRTLMIFPIRPTSRRFCPRKRPFRDRRHRYTKLGHARIDNSFKSSRGEARAHALSIHLTLQKGEPCARTYTTLEIIRHMDNVENSMRWGIAHAQIVSTYAGLTLPKTFRSSTCELSPEHVTTFYDSVPKKWLI